MVRLMSVTKGGRWIDLGLRNLTGDSLRRVEERFAGVNGGGGNDQVPPYGDAWKLDEATTLDYPFPQTSRA
jgi:enoyl reductase-like protein